jgi:hypothetical protein
MTGLEIKADNGSGINLAEWLPKGRRLHDATIYTVSYNGVSIDLSTITSIQRSRSGWEALPTANT